MTSGLLPLCWQSCGHLLACPLASPSVRPKASFIAPRRRSSASHRAPKRVRAAIVESIDDQDLDVDADVGTGHGNGASDREDLYSMETASKDVLYKRFFELLDAKWGDVKEGDKVTGSILEYGSRSFLLACQAPRKTARATCLASFQWLSWTSRPRLQR